MDCDEATRFMSIAESKLEQRDFLGAKKYALIAQTLFPGLGGISKLLTTLDVYLSAEKKINGEVDFYGVLGVNPSDDYATIYQKYKRLALMLHPDKNSSVGADGGFQLISEAKMMLLDNEKRAAYDETMGYKGVEQKTPAPCGPHPNEVPAYTDSQSVHPRPNQRNATVRTQKDIPSAPPRQRHKNGPHKARGHTSCPSVNPQHEFSTHPGGSSEPSRENHFFGFANWKASMPKSQNRDAKAPWTATPDPPPRDTFWTACRECYYTHEYHKIFCCNIIICAHCSKPFIAVDITVTLNFPGTAKPVPWPRRKRSYQNFPSQNAYGEAAQNPGSGPGQHNPNSSNLKRSRASTGFVAQGGAYGMGITGSSGTSDEPKSTGVLTPLQSRERR